MCTCVRDCAKKKMKGCTRECVVSYERVSHGIYEGVMSHINESLHIRIRHTHDMYTHTQTHIHIHIYDEDI